MPPSKHSGSSRSAHKDSDQIATDSNYTLGDYSFRLERSSGTSPNYDKIEAICTKGGKNARKSIQVPSSMQMDGWYVEANETEATVYAVIKTPKGDEEATSDIVSGPVIFGGAISFTYKVGSNINNRTVNASPGSAIAAFQAVPHTDLVWIQAGSSPIQDFRSYTHNGKTVYFMVTGFSAECYDVSPVNTSRPGSDDAIAWTMIYGNISGQDYDYKEMLVGRFAIELEDAGGVGPGSDWIDPGDYDPDWEEGDPTHTLYVTVTGALSGRHNDPIEDPSYSYIPSDKDTVKDYGCGGDGGHGGGGGAGASTVVVHKFATNQANSKEVTAIARRHGYGSGGGKGGKGGDGCILVYY